MSVLVILSQFLPAVLSHGPYTAPPPVFTVILNPAIPKELVTLCRPTLDLVCLVRQTADNEWGLELCQATLRLEITAPDSVRAS